MTKATLKAVAQLAGVSLATASQTLNRKGAISQDTRERVLAAAHKLGYAHRQLPLATNHAIGTITMVVKRDPEEKVANPFHYRIIRGIEAQCRLLDITLHFATINVDENSHAVEPLTLTEPDTDGLLIVGAVIDDPTTFAASVKDRPVVFINGQLIGQPYTNVEADNIAGSRAATRYLIEQGHRAIGFVGGGHKAHPSISQRREGYERMMAEHQLPSHSIDSTLLRMETGVAAAHQLLTAHPELTALVTANDNLAIAAAKAARQLGYQLPENLSIIGFDDQHGVEHLTPALTTMRIDTDYMGRLGVNLLCEHASNPKRPTTTTLIHPKLVVRSSVARL